MNHLIPKHSRSQALIDHAYTFAKAAHGDQKRKYTGDPYITHPLAVANIVAGVTDDCNMICAAILHDVIEDTDVTFEQIRDLGFGHPIAILVRELSDISVPKDGNRAIRKKIDRDHTATISDNAKTIKLADLIHNSISICQYDENFARVFMKEKAALLQVLIGGDMSLYEQATNIVARFNKR